MALLVGQAKADGPDFDQVVSLRIDGRAVDGTVETSRQIRDSPGNEDAILERNIFRLPRNGRFQLEVTLHSGNRTIDYTGSPRLKYAPAGCLTVSEAGLLTVEPSIQGASPDYAMLTIFLFDSQGNPSTYNYYLFVIE